MRKLLLTLLALLILTPTCLADVWIVYPAVDGITQESDDGNCATIIAGDGTVACSTLKPK